MPPEHSAWIAERERERDWLRRDPMDGAMHSVWLHGNWRFLTSKMTAGQREAAADAVQRYNAVLEPDEPLPPHQLRWWRSDAPAQ